MPALCRDCGWRSSAPPADSGCPSCRSGRLLSHPDLDSLAIAHVDCDAFYAAIEKRDRPELADTPLIVGGSIRGVVTTCCYIARRSGVRSAMPMGQALRLCPHAVVLRPDMEKYRSVSAAIHRLMRETAPAVEPVSIDEAYLDLTARSEDAEPPARSLARLALRIERRIGITVSIGLAPNRLLAKIASDLGKPRGFRLIGAAEAAEVLAPLPVRALPGVGPVMAERLAALGIGRIGELRSARPDDLAHRFGASARRLQQFAAGEDDRRIAILPRQRKSISAETTFEHDLTSFREISVELEVLCERLAERLRRADLAAQGVTLKLRRSDRQIVTRARSLARATQRSSPIFRALEPLLAAELVGTGSYRLVGVNANRLVGARQADPPDLFGTG
jgi:DNA polymerase-4